MSEAPSASNEYPQPQEKVDQYLLGQIAREMHESWLKGRQAEGWKYAAIHNAQNKVSPDIL